jgi:hypothetical protein
MAARDMMVMNCFQKMQLHLIELGVSGSDWIENSAGIEKQGYEMKTKSTGTPDIKSASNRDQARREGYL